VRKDKGFTLIELMVVIAILGVLAATAFPTYRTFRRRAVGAEATTIMKDLINAEIMYFLENNGYFPDQTVGGSGDPLGQFLLAQDDPPGDPDIRKVKDALKVTLPVRHFLDFQIKGIPDPLDPNRSSQVVIQIDANFPIFRDGSKHIMTTIDKEGTVNTIVF